MNKNHTIKLGIFLTFLPVLLYADEPPKNLNQALSLLPVMLGKEVSNRIAGDQDTRIPMPLAMGIRNEWKLNQRGDPSQRTELVQFFNKLGIYSAELMLEIIVEAFRSQQRGEDFDLIFELESIFSNYSIAVNLPAYEVFKDLPDKYILVANLITANASGHIEVRNIAEWKGLYLISSENGHWVPPTKNQMSRIQAGQIIRFPLPRKIKSEDFSR